MLATTDSPVGNAEDSDGIIIPYAETVGSLLSHAPEMVDKVIALVEHQTIHAYPRTTEQVTTVMDTISEAIGDTLVDEEEGVIMEILDVTHRHLLGLLPARVRAEQDTAREHQSDEGLLYELKLFYETHKRHAARSVGRYESKKQTHVPEILQTMMDQYPLLGDPAREAFLARCIRQLKNTYPRWSNIARDILAFSNVRLIMSEYGSYFDTHRHGNKNHDDLANVGLQALVVAADRFDPDRGASFATHAGWWLKSGIHGWLRSKSQTIRVAAGSYYRALKVRRALEKIYPDGDWDDADIRSYCEENDLKEELVRDALEITSMQPTSLDESSDEDGEMTLHSLIEDDGADDRIFSEVDTTTRRHMIAVLLAATFPANSRGKYLAHREMVIARMGFATGGPEKSDAIAERFGVTPAMVGRITTEATGFERRARRILQQTMRTLHRNGIMNPTLEDAISELEREHGSHPIPWYNGTLPTRNDCIPLPPRETPTKVRPPQELPPRQLHQNSLPKKRGRKRLRSELSSEALLPFARKQEEELVLASHLNKRHPIQMAIFQSMLDDIKSGKRKGTLLLPARVGKTTIYIEMLRFFKNHLRQELHLPGRVIFVVPTEALLRQTAARIHEFFPQTSYGVFYGHEKNLSISDVTLTTCNSFVTIVENGLLRPEQIGMVFSDEAHRNISPRRRQAIETLSHAIHIAGTATGEYDENRSVLEVFPHVYYDMSDLQAMQLGLVAPCRTVYVETGTDISSVRFTAKDWEERDLSRKINTPERNQLIIDTYKTLQPGKTLIQCGTIDHAVALEHLCKMSGINAIAIHSESRTHREDLQAYLDGKYEMAISPRMLAEGIDDRFTRCVMLANPTCSAVLQGQRCTRANTYDKWKYALIVDFIDEVGAHKQVTPDDVFLKNHRRATHNEGFSHAELRAELDELIMQQIEGPLPPLPDSIQGHRVGYDLAGVEHVLHNRTSRHAENLKLLGVQYQEPPDDWPSLSELIEFAGMKKDKLTDQKLSKYIVKRGTSKSRAKYRSPSGGREKEYISPHIIVMIYQEYFKENPTWVPPIPLDLDPRDYTPDMLFSRKKLLKK